VVVIHNVAKVDHGDHVGDRERHEVGTVAEDRAEVEDAAIRGGVTPITAGLGKLMRGHPAEFIEETDGMAEAGGVLQQRVEFGAGDRPVFLTGDAGLRNQMVAQALPSEVFELRRGLPAEVRRGERVRRHGGPYFA
jgi:hypothetical protein